MTKKLTAVSLAVAVLLLAVSTLQAAGTYKNIDPLEMRKLLTENAGQVYLIDSRTGGEFFQERIETSRLFRTDLSKRQFFQKLNALPTDKPYVIYCTTGMRSETVAKLMAQTGKFPGIYNLAGGIIAWKRAKFPVLHGPPR